MSAGAVAETVTLGDLRRQAGDLLRDAGIVNAVREADWLLASALGVPSHALILEGERPVSALQAERARSFLRRRAARAPLQYILGTQEFRGLDIAVTPAVLIPRPETELLVAEALRAVVGVKEPMIADVGTGSGCIAVAIAREHPGATIYAFDFSGGALVVARSNAIRHGVSARIRFIQADLLEACGGESAGAFDAVVSNPPYIPEQELEELQPEVARYEPRMALAAGPDGLTFYRRLLRDAPPLVKTGGRLIMELGFGQAEAVTRLAWQSGAFDSVECRKDAAGVVRVLIARRAAQRGS